MKILYVSQYFPPEMGAPAARAIELSRHWARAGHAVTVLTGFPNHPTGFVPPEWRPRLRNLIYRETVDGISVVRTWLWPLPNRKALERMLNYASFCVSAALRGMELSRPGIVVGTSPQLLVALSAWWIAFWHRVPFVFEVRDLWPESLSAVGMGREDSWLHRVLGAIAGFLYRRCDRIVVVTPAFKERLIKHWHISPAKISIVENGVESDLFSPDVRGARIRRDLNLDGKFVAGYIGTMGMAHGLDTLIQAAVLLQKSHPNVAFLLVGEGAEKERIEAAIHSENLQNTYMVDQQPRERIPAYISSTDICLVLLRKTELFKTVIPTKMLEFMSCARPVILGVEGQAREILEEAQGGIAIEPENPKALAEAIVALAGDRSGCQRLGGNGRRYIRKRYSREQTASLYVETLEQVIKGKRVRA